MRLLLQIGGKHAGVQVTVYRLHAVVVYLAQRIDLQNIGKADVPNTAHIHLVIAIQAFVMYGFKKKVPIHSDRWRTGDRRCRGRQPQDRLT